MSENDTKNIDTIITNLKPGEIITFKEISETIFHNKHWSSAIGRYIHKQRERENYPYWRVVNSGNHPVADRKAISELENEGHKIENGRII